MSYVYVFYFFQLKVGKYTFFKLLGRFRALAALPEVPDSVPSIHMVAHKYLYGQSQEISLLTKKQGDESWL